jgi:hypothetical protein
MCPGIILRRLTGLRMLFNSAAYRTGSDSGRLHLVMAESDALDCIEALTAAENLLDFLLREDLPPETLPALPAKGDNDEQ